MKRFVAILLVFVLAMGIFPAYAAVEWTCDKCDTVNDGKFCGECGSPKPVWTCSECSKENTTKYCSNCGIPKEYSDGTHALNNKEFEKAADIFSTLNYGDSKVKHIMAIGQWGVQLWEQEQYDDAVEKAEYVYDLFMRAAAYDSTFLVEHETLYSEMCIFSFAAYYSVGSEACDEGLLGYAINMYEQAYSFLEQIPAEDMEEFGGHNKVFYSYAEWLMQVKSYDLAAKWFGKCGDYLDSASKVSESQAAAKEKKYTEAVALKESGKHEEAITAFKAMNGYKDSAEQIAACQEAIKERDYTSAVALKTTRQYQKALSAFEALNGYKDSAEQVIDCKYLRAVQLLTSGKDVDAFNLFLEIRPYKDSETYLDKFKFVIAKETDGSASDTTTYKYNDQGLLIEKKRGDGTLLYNYEYNANGQKVLLRYVWYDQKTTTTYSYDTNGNLILEKETGVFGKYDDTEKETTAYEYDNQQRLVKRVFSSYEDSIYPRLSFTDLYLYNEASLITTEYSYDELNWSDELSFVLYEYNSDGQCTHKIKCIYTDYIWNTEFEKFEKMNQNERLQFIGNKYVVEDEFTYIYENGLLIEERRDYEGEDTKYYSDYTIKYSYDSSGNVVRKSKTDDDGTEITHYTYENTLLTKEERGDWWATYEYDEFGNLIKKTYSSGSVWTYTYRPVYSQE